MSLDAALAIAPKWDLVEVVTLLAALSNPDSSEYKSVEGASCGICNPFRLQLVGSVSRHNNAANHVMSHLSNRSSTGSGRYKSLLRFCWICESGFPDEDSYRTHVSEAHGGKAYRGKAYRGEDDEGEDDGGEA